MTTSRLACGLLLVALAAAPTSAKDDGPPAYVVSLLAPEAAPGPAIAAEFAAGVEAAFTSATVADPRVTLRRDAFPAAGKEAATLAAWKKAEAAAVLAWAPDGELGTVERLAEKARVPFIVLSPEPTRPVRDAAANVFWAGGVRTPDEALQAMDFLLLPMGSKRPALLHDGSARGADAAARCLRLHHVSQDPVAPALLAETFDAAAAKALAASGADGVAYFGGPAGAERLLAAATAADVKLPVLLGQGLANAAVPTFVSGGAKTAWALEAEWFEDFGEVAKDDRAILRDAAKAAGAPLSAAMVRGYRAGRWTVDALREAGAAEPKKLVPALRALHRPGARGKRVFDEVGHATLARLGPWRSAPERDEPAFRRVRPTLVPMQAIPQIGTFHPSRFEWVEGTTHVHCTWAAGAARTIEKDLQVLGLNTGGYEGELEQRILDDLMGRFLSRMNRLFLRNPDGSAVPGLSYRISFTTTPPGKDVKGRKLQVVLAGDDPAAGGRASGNLAMIFTTFLQRTMYAERKLVPPISASDRPYLSGAYKWGTALEQNLRCDTVRALVDGYSQAMALTGAHELGHLHGPDHETESPRSIMNVVDAVGLDFDWAEWIPRHAEMLEKQLGREPAPRER